VDVLLYYYLLSPLHTRPSIVMHWVEGDAALSLTPRVTRICQAGAGAGVCRTFVFLLGGLSHSLTSGRPCDRSLSRAAE